MAWDVIFFIAGAILAWLTLRDVFDTVVVPGGSRASLRVTKRVGLVLLVIWKRLRGRNRGISHAFAPLVLVSSFVIWMSLLALAFGLMAYAMRTHFEPHLESLPEAVFMVGSAIVTIGLTGENVLGAGRWIILASGFCGLAVMTMAVTYLLEVQNSITRRDIGIIKLNTSAGQPPSALTLLERYAAIRHKRGLPEVLEEGRNWCATVRQSHSAHPSLIYFQSTSTGAGWAAALGALLDLSLFAEFLIDDDSLYGPAVLLKEEGERMAKELALISGVERVAEKTDQNALRSVAKRLADSGYKLRGAPDYADMARQRTDYSSCVDAIARHLGKPSAPLMPSADARPGLSAASSYRRGSRPRRTASERPAQGATAHRR
ncbi:MAG TPA: hypothetical protein VE968_06035 [Sphingomicrobium sp.]|nr:hypothetical protein [Sphingomicrobium sp.]